MPVFIYSALTEKGVITHVIDSVDTKNHAEEVLALL